MDITSVNSASPYASMLENMLKNNELETPLAEGKLPVDNPDVALSQLAPKKSAVPNLMAQNFVDSSQGESKYIKAKKNALQADKEMLNRQNAILATALAEKAALGEDASYAKLALIGKKAARRIKNEMQTSVREESEKHLEEARKKLAQETEETFAPKDAEGKPLPPLDPEQDSQVPSDVPKEAEVPSDISNQTTAPEPNNFEPANLDPNRLEPNSFTQVNTENTAVAGAETEPLSTSNAPNPPKLDKYV